MLVSLCAAGCAREVGPPESPPDSPPASPPEQQHPAADGHELVGRALPEWTFSDWSGSEPLTLASLRGKVVVVRFWTTDCPYCDKTMPALEALWGELRDQPVVFVGAFHDKPPGSHPDMKRALESVAVWKVSFPIAFDRGWKTLDAWWLGSAHRHATSATFVIGKDGKVAFVHPGPVFHPSDDPSEADANRGYREIRQAIERAIALP